MNSDRYIFRQVLNWNDRKTLTRLAERYNIRARHLRCPQQLICMGLHNWPGAIENLRDIEECLNAKSAAALNHFDLREPVARVTLAEANEQRATGGCCRIWPRN
jgi:hypothetical protein